MKLLILRCSITLFNRLATINSFNFRPSLYNIPSGSILIEGTGGVIMIFKFGISVWMKLFFDEKKYGFRARKPGVFLNCI